jgi:two-component system sensor histidine kinase PhoQ
MNQIVGHQLQRAAASGRSSLTPNLSLHQVVERLAGSLSKVYADKQIQWQIEIPETAGFKGDEGDLMELLGNLMDNACKYGRGRVRIELDTNRPELRVADDGPGIPADQANQVVQRGHRADQQQPGQGIGLAVAMDILKAYGGRLAIGRSERLGGAEMRLLLPWVQAV